MAKRKTETNKSKKPVAVDLFKFITDLTGRNLTDEESEILTESAKTFVADSFLPNSVYDKEVLKETVLVNEWITKADFEDFEDEDDDYLTSKEFDSRYGRDEMVDNGNEY